MSSARKRQSSLHYGIRIFFWYLARCVHLLVGQGPACRFQPTCSQYVAGVISKHGVAKGSVLSLRRLMRCHPWGSSGWDPIPPSGKIVIGHISDPACNAGQSVEV